ncbi:hypothetical protein [Caulobacter sp. LARHSG274]
MKKAFGKPVQQPALEDFNDMRADTTVAFTIAKAAKTKAPEKPKAAEKQARRPKDKPAIVATPSPPSPPIVTMAPPPSIELDLHPILEITRKKLLSPNPVGGLARSGGKGAFSVSVSPDEAPRALQVLNHLLLATEGQGWAVTHSEKGLQLCPDGEAVNFTLAEQIDRVRHKVTDTEREALARFETRRAAAVRRGDWFSAGNPPQIPDWDYRPTGCFVFQLDPNPYSFGAATGLRRTFGESRSRRLEGQMERIIEALAARAAAMKEIRRLTAERDAQWAEEAARRKEAERRQRLETKRQEFLERQLERHEAARRLESFLARYNQADLGGDPEAANFINWARGRLARLGDDLTPEALGERFAVAELMNDDADIPSWKEVE